MAKQIYHIGQSHIHGLGIISDCEFQSNQIIDIGIYYLWIIPMVTSHFGSYINHSYKPNSHLIYLKDKYYVVASIPIHKGEEISLDYRKAPWFIEGPKYGYK